LPSSSHICLQLIKQKEGEGKDMPKYVIEREVPGIGNATDEEVQAISQKSCSVLNQLGPTIQWLHSYVTADKIYCVYIAPNQKMIREHAQQGGFPANRVSEVKSVIDPTTAE
jgi:hypothetical protein